MCPMSTKRDRVPVRQARFERRRGCVRSPRSYYSNQLANLTNLRGDRDSGSARLSGIETALATNERRMDAVVHQMSEISRG